MTQQAAAALSQWLGRLTLKEVSQFQFTAEKVVSKVMVHGHLIKTDSVFYKTPGSL